MIDELKLFNLPADYPFDQTNNGEIFILNTCQRSLALGFNLIPYKSLGPMPKETTTLMGSDAYVYLLETICGLQSKVLGENEIVDQFKVAYNQFSSLPNKNSYIQSLIEKLFKDAKSIRTSYLLGLGQLSYAGIARKIITSKFVGSNILILGSGQLAKDCAKLLDRKYDLHISSRSQEKIKLFKDELHPIGLKTVAFKNFNKYQDFDIIVNTIGCTGLTLLDEEFFRSWNSKSGKLFIDLGSPSVIDTTYGVSDGIYRLADIFEMSENLNSHKLKKVSEAKVAMNQIAQKRKTAYSLHFPYAWEDMQFA